MTEYANIRQNCIKMPNKLKVQKNVKKCNFLPIFCFFLPIFAIFCIRKYSYSLIFANTQIFVNTWIFVFAKFCEYSYNFVNTNICKYLQILRNLCTQIFTDANTLIFTEIFAIANICDTSRRKYTRLYLITRGICWMLNKNPPCHLVEKGIGSRDVWVVEFVSLNHLHIPAFICSGACMSLTPQIPYTWDLLSKCWKNNTY
jgi:hypothetical protein